MQNLSFSFLTITISYFTVPNKLARLLTNELSEVQPPAHLQQDFRGKLPAMPSPQSTQLAPTPSSSGALISRKQEVLLVSYFSFKCPHRMVMSASASQQPSVPSLAQNNVLGDRQHSAESQKALMGPKHPA